MINDKVRKMSSNPFLHSTAQKENNRRKKSTNKSILTPTQTTNSNHIFFQRAHYPTQDQLQKINKNGKGQGNQNQEKVYPLVPTFSQV